MLLISAVVALLAIVGCAVVVKVAQVAMRRLGLEFWNVAFWFGLADAPLDELAAKRVAS